LEEHANLHMTKHSGRTHFTEMIRFLEEHPQVRIQL
jgi:hypothetical protein